MSMRYLLLGVLSSTGDKKSYLLQSQNNLNNYNKLFNIEWYVIRS